MPEYLACCPLCNERQSTPFDQREFDGYLVINRLCLSCGLVYQSPRMTKQELETFYHSEYRRIYQGSENPIQKDLSVQEARSKFLVMILKENLGRKIQRHLDIGSSSGVLLHRVRDEFQCQVVGIEPGNAYRNYAEESGLRVYASLDDVRDAGEKPFDLITMVHVLEHIVEPVHYLIQLREVYLKPSDGRLLIEVPNLYAHDCFELAHQVSFSQSTLLQTLRKAGYTTQILLKHGQPRSNLIPLYITLLAAPVDHIPDQNKVERERGIKLKRFAGMTHRRIIERLFPEQAWLPEYHKQ
jgi:2-polyprenyl-3-methyl-5-hydroxy-6-metoxy-1,4-benzoquinol methylase